MLCPECYSDSARATPLLRPGDCLIHHTQYICGTCGRCICIEHDDSRGLQRWNFPFRSLDIAKLYLRTADYTRKTPCGIYAIQAKNGRVSYKIFATVAELRAYLKQNPDKTCQSPAPVYAEPAYRDYPATQVRRLTPTEAEAYLSEQGTRPTRTLV